MKTFCTSKKDLWKRRAWFLVQVLCVSNLLLPTMAHAYVDPGSGSVIVTAVLGLIAAIGYTFRKYFYKLKRAIFGDNTESEKED